jgi:hypothetical protein
VLLTVHRPQVSRLTLDHTFFHPNATYQSVNATTNHKTFGKYTTEALPHMDHYRNLLSATNALKSRPTLAELHEEKVNSKDFLLILEA